MEFVVHRIKEIAKLYSGGDAPEILSDVRTKECCVPVFSNGLSQEGLYGYTNKAQIFENAITISARGTIGAVFYRREPFLPIVRLISLIPNTKLVSTDFLYYYLKSIHIDGFGTSQQQLTIPFLGKKKIRIIKDIPTQKKIASILSAYDDLIEKNNRKIAILQQMAEELYKEWFVRRKSNQWPIVKMREFGYQAESGKRPKGGIDDSLSEGVPSLGAEVIDKLGMFDFSNVKLVPEEFYQGMKKGIGKNKDILLYKDGAYIGKVTLFMNDFPYKKYAVNEHVFLIRANSNLYQYYLYFTLNQQQYFTQMQNLNRNAAQPGLTHSDIDIIKLFKPDEETIKNFNRVIEPMLYSIFTIAKQNENLKTQRDLLLPRLMSGKLKVKA